METNFDLAAIVANRKQFAQYLENMLKLPAEPTRAAFANWAQSMPPLEAAAAGSYWLLDGQQCVKLDKLVFRVLELAVRNGVSIGWIIENVPATIREGLFSYLKSLEVKGLVSYLREGALIRSTASVREDERRRMQNTKSAPAWKIAATDSTTHELVQIAS